MIFSEFGLLGLNSIFGNKKAPFFSIVLKFEVVGRSLSTVKALPQESLYLLKYGEISFWSPEPLISNPEVEREIFFSLSKKKPQKAVEISIFDLFILHFYLL